MSGQVKGANLITGNTAAYRGKLGAALYAQTSASQRILAEAMARDLWAKGIHVAYVAINARIDTLRSRPFATSDKPVEFFSKPTAIAEEDFHIAHQDRSTWVLDVMIRPFGENL